LLIGLEFLPYSPRWLLEQGRDEEARAVVHRFHGDDGRFEEMQANIKAELQVRSRRLSDLWKTAAMRKRTFVAVGVQVFGQFSGINVIAYFGPKMYAGLGLNTDKSLLVQGIYGTIGPIVNLIFIIFILDSVGRRKPLIFGASSFVITFSILAAIVACFPPGAGTNKSAQMAGLAMIFLTNICFSLSFGPVSWVLASEVFPTRTRSIGTSVATASNWAFNVMISEVSPIALENVGWKFYILFIVLNAVDLVIITLFFPETKGKILEEMAVIFGDDINVAEVLGSPRIDKASTEKDRYIHEA